MDFRILASASAITNVLNSLNKPIIQLGTWDGNPIEWIVLKEESFGVLALSKSILFQSKFDDSINNWRKSYICKYLNNEFYNKAFDSSEKARIVNVKLEDVENTKNNVFLLSRSEAENLLDTPLRAIGVWLLRTPWDGGDNHRILRVLDDGRISLKNSGCTSSCDVQHRYGIRPAIYIKENQ